MASRFYLPLADVGSGIKPSSGALLYFYTTGTSTPKDTYTDAGAGIPNSNPVVADSTGLFPAIFIDGSYKVILKDKDLTQKWEEDGVTSESSGGTGGGLPANVDLTTIATGATPNTYNSEPIIIQLNNGNLFCVYQNASGHLTTDGILLSKISTDGGVTWGGESVVYAPISGESGRNPGIGYDEASGRITVFAREWDGVNTLDLVYLISEDSGATFGAPISVYSQFPAGGNSAPFGKTIVTSLGMVQAFYKANSNSIYLLRSNDGGQTWGNLINVVPTFNTPTYNEPYLIKIDDSRVVMALRDESDSTRMYFFTSEDGGLTWENLNTQTVDWTDNIYSLPVIAGTNYLTPYIGVRDRNSIIFTWGARDPMGMLIVQKFEVNAFFSSPAQCVTRNPFTYAYQSKILDGTARGAEFGYPSITALADGGYYFAWYDSTTGNGTTDTSIYGMTIDL